MKKILTVILGLAAITSLYAANTEVARLTLTGQGGVENSYITLRVDPTVTTAQTGAFFQNTDLDGNVNLYISNNTEKCSSYKKDNLTNLPLEVITNRREAANQHYTITFNVPTSTVGLKLKDLKTGDNVDIVNNGTYEFDVNTTLHSDYVEGTNYVVKDRFVINYTFVNMKGNFDNPSGEWNWVGDFDRNGSILTKEVTLAADTWYNFFMNINGTEMHNNSEFSRGDAPKGGFPAAEGTNCWMHTDMAGVYTFTWNHATQELTVTYPTIVVKGANASDGTDVVLTPAADGSKAEGTIDFAGQAGEWYTFGIQLNGAWIGDNAAFTRANYERAISGNQNMWFEIEDGTVDYVYTFTWTFASNTLTIGYPDQIPAPSCVTVRDNLEVNRYYTICLPQEVVSANGASFWNLSRRGEGVAYLEEAELPLEAGRPYIFQAEAEELCVVYGNAVPAASAGAEGALVGTFAAMDQSALDAEASAAGSDIYLLYNNKLWLANGQSGNNLPAYRAYIVYDELIQENPAPAPGRRVRAIPMGGQGTTGVENLNAAEAPVKTVIDGKMYIIRGEHMFDATGRIVK